MAPPLIHLNAATGSAVSSRCAAVSTSRYNGLDGFGLGDTGQAELAGQQRPGHQ